MNMMRIFSILMCLMVAAVASAQQFSAVFTQTLVEIQKSQNNTLTIKTDASSHANNIYEKASFSVENYQYRLILKNKKIITFAAKEKDEIAFTIRIEGELTPQNTKKIHEFIQEHKKKRAISSNAKAGYQSLFEKDDIEKQPDTISTANILSWNRLLKDAYQGNVSGSLGGSSSGGSSSTSADAGEDEGGSYDNAASMAKMMNQCGGNNKSSQAHKQAMKNIAQALVMNAAAAANNHDIARASESYADQSRKYKKHNKESILETLDKMKNIDQAKLFQSLQSEKRKIEKGLQRGEISYVFEDSEVDQNSLRLLQKLIQQHGRLKVLKNFQFIGRKIIIDAQHFEQFAKQPTRTFIYLSKKRKWAINPLLSSEPQYRKALVEILWSYMNKRL